VRAHDGGRLKSQNLDGAEFPLYLCSNGETKPECSQIKVVRPEQIPPERRDDPFAAGGDTMNSQLGFAVHERALVRHQLDGDRVQPALPLARPDPDRAPGRRNRRADLAHRVQPEAGGRARPGAAGRSRLAPARRPIGLPNTAPALREVEHNSILQGRA
jgi:hypothetical protein